MFITSREKSIIELIVKTAGKHTVQSMAAYLHVSVRTIQRDLKSVNKILNQFDLELSRTQNDGLIVNGKNEHIYKLMQSLTDLHPTDETLEERKLRLLIILLNEGQSFKTQVLAKQLGVSTATLAAYLDDLADWLSKFQINLTRKRGVGIELAGREADMRKALASYFFIHFYEDLIESLYLLQTGNQIEGPVLGYFSPVYLAEVDALVNNTINKGQTRLADSDYIGLIVHICITVQRTESGFLLEEDEHAPAEEEWINKIADELKDRLSLSLTREDIHLLSVILRGSKLQAADAVEYDRIMLAQLIKNIIHDVSAQLHVDLSDDFSLYQGLLAHMEPSVFRLKQDMELYNPLTSEIKKKYPVLFMAVKNSLNKEFTDIDFPDDEIAFIVLHFGSALLMNEEKTRINAVVVCPTGIGASKMLASRIQKEIVEINSVEILSMKDFQQADLNNYDVVISTVRLPFTDIDYILVSPLLSEEDIEVIHDFLQRNVQKLTRHDTYYQPENRKQTPSPEEKPAIKELLEEIKIVHSSIESILKNLRVYRTTNKTSHYEILREMVDQARLDGLLSDSDRVMEQLYERERKGGLGIPKTNMGLFHCRDEHIHELVFQVSHLEHPFTIEGMDGDEVHMKNLLLMLAPEELSLREQEVLSLISTSLIENDVAMMIFSSSNEEMISKKLEDLFLEYLQNNLIKE
ncbi:BglG family transcription antiterminator [Sediminibacillus massiliensis]|uniref:BglG family transcription antiterminator n=1 Tax=Sediminibacillus massiliensis TaxID=1926277 RepID=UPI0009883C6D|nr:PRD domain-containing protein [Sediminibacillus massiliensis]